MDEIKDRFSPENTPASMDAPEELNPNPDQSRFETQTQSSSETTSSLPPSGNKVPKILILVLVLLFAIIISGGYFFYQNQKTENITTSTQGQLSPTPNPTSNWKIYRNENWGFELRYPPNWTYSESSWDGGENETSVDYDGIHLSPPSSTRGITQINVYKVKNNGLNIKDYFNKNDYSCCGPDAEPTYLGDEIMASEKVIVDGIEGRKALKVPEDIPIEEVTANWVVLEKDGEIFLISNYKDVKELDLDIEKVFDQILSTFKFLPDISNWKTYKNEDYGFEFKYPREILEICNTHSSDEIVSFYESFLNCNLKPDSQSILEMYVYNPKSFIIETIELGKPLSVKKVQVSGYEFSVNEYTPSYKKDNEKVIIAKTKISEETFLELNFTVGQILNEHTIDQILSTFEFLNIRTFNGQENYTNNKLGFSFKPPDGWNLNNESNPVQFANYIPAPDEGRDYDPELDDGKLKLEIYYERSFDDLQKFVAERKTEEIEEFDENTVWIEIQTVLDGQKAVKVTTEWFGIRHFSIYVIHPDKKMLFTISFGLDFNDHQSVMNQILSTFEFIE